PVTQRVEDRGSDVDGAAPLDAVDAQFDLDLALTGAGAPAGARRRARRCRRVLRCHGSASGRSGAVLGSIPRACGPQPRLGAHSPPPEELGDAHLSSIRASNKHQERFLPTTTTPRRRGFRLATALCASALAWTVPACSAAP